MVENHDDQTPQGGTSLERYIRQTPYQPGDIVYQRNMHFGGKPHVHFHRVRIISCEKPATSTRRYLVEHADEEEGTSYPYEWVTKRIGELECYLHPTLDAAKVAAYLQFKEARDRYQSAMDGLGVHKDDDEVWGIFWLKKGAEVDHAQNYTMTHATKDGKWTLCGLEVGRMAQTEKEADISCKRCRERMP